MRDPSGTYFSSIENTNPRKTVQVRALALTSCLIEPEFFEIDSTHRGVFSNTLDVCREEVEQPCLMCSFSRTLSLLAGSVTIAIQQELRCMLFCLTSVEVELSQGPAQPLVLHTNDCILRFLSYTGALLQYQHCCWEIAEEHVRTETSIVKKKKKC